MSISSRGQRTSLHQTADAMLASLPVLGCSNTPKIICLAHLSADPQILTFHVDVSLCVWSDRLAVDPKGIADITAEGNPRSYRALYLIRVGVEDALNESEVLPMKRTRPGASEYAIGFPLRAGDFGRILIAYDETKDQLVAV